MHSPGQILDLLVEIETEVEPEIEIDEAKLISLINDRGYTILDIELIVKGASRVELFQFLAHEPSAQSLEEDALDARIAQLETKLGISDSLTKVGFESLEIYVDFLSTQNPILLRELAISYYEKYIKNAAKIFLQEQVSDNEIKFLQTKIFYTALIAHKASNYQDLVSICLACKIHSEANPDTPRTTPKILIDHLDQFAAVLETRANTTSLKSLLVDMFTSFPNDFSTAVQQKLQLKERLILSQQSTRAISDEKTLLYTANDFVKGYFSFIPDIEQLKNRKLTSRPQSDAYTVLWEFLIAVYKLDLKEYKVQLPFAKRNSSVDTIINKHLSSKLKGEALNKLVTALELITAYEEKCLRILSRVGFGWDLFFNLLNQSAKSLENNAVDATNVLEYLLKTITNSYLLIASLWCCCTNKKKELDIDLFNTHFVPLLEKSPEELTNIFKAIPSGKPEQVLYSLAARMGELRRLSTSFPLSDSPILSGQKRERDSTDDFAEHKKSKEEETDLDQEGSLDCH